MKIIVCLKQVPKNDSVLVRDPLGELDPKACFTTDPAQVPVSVAEAFVLRWTISDG
jgi:hypothetical protein